MIQIIAERTLQPALVPLDLRQAGLLRSARQRLNHWPAALQRQHKVAAEPALAPVGPPAQKYAPFPLACSTTDFDVNIRIQEETAPIGGAD